ncbi:MAG: efflux RND transporter periplasmic adaptor subunit [Gammaproteobacteria bacterium]
MFSQKKPPESKPIVDVAPLVEVLQLQPSRVQFQVESQGTVQPAVTTTLNAEVAGPIISVSSAFVAGGVFAANETLLQIDPTVYQAAVRQTEAVLNQRQIEYDGAKQLGAKNYRSKIDLAAAEAALEVARADVTRSRRDLDKTRVRLPYAGIVREKSVDVGQFVGVGAALGTAFGTDILEVRLPLSQSDQRFLNLPQASETDNTAANVAVTLSGKYRGRDTTWPATIVRTEGIIDQTNRVTYAVAQILDPYRRRQDSPLLAPLPVGTFASAQIDGLYVDDVLEVPRSAVRGNGQLLFIDNENQLRIRQVDVINSNASVAYVAANSVAERRLVVTTIEAPVNGQQVRVEGEEPPLTTRSGDATAASE